MTTVSPFESPSKLRVSKKFESLKKLSNKTKCYKVDKESKISSEGKSRSKNSAFSYYTIDEPKSPESDSPNEYFSAHPNIKIKVELYCDDKN